MQVGSVVRSVAGHDRDRFYVVVRMDRDRVFIADGRARKLAAPKAKNPLHVRPTAAVLDLEAVPTDKKLREALGAFGRSEQEGGC